MAYLDTLVERVSTNMAFHEEPPLMEIWSRVKMEKILKAQRTDQKRNIPGWTDIK